MSGRWQNQKISVHHKTTRLAIRPELGGPILYFFAHLTLCRELLPCFKISVCIWIHPANTSIMYYTSLCASFMEHKDIKGICNLNSPTVSLRIKIKGREVNIYWAFPLCQALKSMYYPIYLSHYEVTIVQSLNWLLLLLLNQAVKLREFAELVLGHRKNKRWIYLIPWMHCSCLYSEALPHSSLKKLCKWSRGALGIPFNFKHRKGALFLSQGGKCQRKMRERRVGWPQRSQLYPSHQSTSFTWKGKVNTD